MLKFVKILNVIIFCNLNIFFEIFYYISLIEIFDKYKECSGRADEKGLIKMDKVQQSSKCLHPTPK